MTALDFIEADVRRQRRSNLAIAMGALIFVAAVAALGLGLREGFEEVFTARNLVPAGLMLAALAAFPWIYLSKKSGALRAVLMGSLLAGVLLLSFVQPQTPVSLQKFQPAGRFWPENLHCIYVGVFVSLLASLAVSAACLWLLPSPSRTWQRILSGVPGVAGLAALTLHCMGPLWSHTVIAHWGQAGLVFPLAYLQQRWVFRRQVARALGRSSQNLKNLGQLDR